MNSKNVMMEISIMEMDVALFVRLSNTTSVPTILLSTEMNVFVILELFLLNGWIIGRSLNSFLKIKL